MVASVPMTPSRIQVDSILNGDPVRSPHWVTYAELWNYLRGQHRMIVPSFDPRSAIAVAGTHTYHLRLFQRQAASHRVWILGLRATAASGYCIATFTDPSGGTSTWTVTSRADGSPQTWIHIETIAARANTESSTSVTILNGATSSSTCTVNQLASFEMCRPELAITAQDYGIDLQEMRGGRVIQQQTIGTPGATLLDDTRDRIGRVLWAWARDPTAAPINITAAGYTAVFASDPVVLARYLYSGETTRAVSVRVRVVTGAATTGNVKFTAASGAVLIIPITAATSAWYTGTLAVHVEDLAVADGRRAGIYEKINILAQRTAGATNVAISAFCIGGA